MLVKLGLRGRIIDLQTQKILSEPGPCALLAPAKPMDKLAEIIAHKRTEVEAILPLASKLRAAALQRARHGGARHRLIKALTGASQ